MERGGTPRLSVAKMMAAGDGIGGRRDDQTVESLLGAVILTHPSDYPSLEWEPVSNRCAFLD